MSKIVEYLRLFRAQTAAATLLLVMTMYLVAGGNLFSVQGMCVALFAVMIHWFSFGANSVTDFAMGWDKADKNKQHHPLASGKITLAAGLKVILWGQIVLTVVAILITRWMQTGNGYWAMAGFAVFIMAGVAYNEGLAKVSVLGFIPICLSFMGLSVWAYYIVAPTITPLAFWLIVYIGFVLWFQIAYSGHLKEIESDDQANLMREFGMRVKDGKFTAGNSAFFGWAVKVMGLLLGGFILIRYLWNPVTFVLYLLLAAGALYFCYRLTRTRTWERNKSLVDMSLVEVLSIFIIPVILMPLVGILPCVLLIIVAIVYFIGINRLLWGTVLRPQV